MSSKYSFESPRHQDFSLRFNLICYIIENPPTSEVLLKLQQTCKYFFAKNKVIVVHKLLAYVPKKRCFIDYYNKKVSIPLGKFKYWFNHIYPKNDTWESFYPFITPHIYRITFKELYVGDQTLSMKTLDLLLSNEKMEFLRFFVVDIRDDNGSVVPVDFILSKIPHILQFDFYNPNEIYSNDVMKKINDVKFVNKLKHFILGIGNTSEDLDVGILFEFIKKHAASDAFIKYWDPGYGPGVSKTFKAQLARLVNGPFPNIRLNKND